MVWLTLSVENQQKTLGQHVTIYHVQTSNSKKYKYKTNSELQMTIVTTIVDLLD